MAECNNLVLEQYGRYKRDELASSPYKFLLDSEIKINSHQVAAFCHAIDALKTGGIILADEVGLGKTIEAGLVLKYVIGKGAKHIIVIVPASLRKQWESELIEKFGISSFIADRYSVEGNYYARNNFKRFLKAEDGPCVVLASYDYAGKLMNSRDSREINWDFCIIDEAHNLRNAFHGAKRARRLYELTRGIPKILLTATPIQNSLEDLYGLVSFIDDKIFSNEEIFVQRYGNEGNISELRDILVPIIQRTLRKDSAAYIHFSKRISRTFDFVLTTDEQRLYNEVDNFLKREWLYSTPLKNRGLVNLVIRKLLASSSFAIADTFHILRERLDKEYNSENLPDHDEAIDFFLDFIDDEVENEDDYPSYDGTEPAETERQKGIADEIRAVDSIIGTAEKITSNSKMEALITALLSGFGYQREHGIPEKAVIFTESKRTQMYISAELEKKGFNSEDIVLFNGDANDRKNVEIYRRWKVKHPGTAGYGRTVEYKHAVMDYFKEHAKILISTDAGSEGLNLQFCNIVINYDLPWNPQKIEQRIGRCHRYGQKNDVVAINLLNRQNNADMRVYEILSKKFKLFDGIFGASDASLGLLESGMGFEKSILGIYQKCTTDQEFNRAFDRLENKMDSRKSDKSEHLMSILQGMSSEEKQTELENTNTKIRKFLRDWKFWQGMPAPEMDNRLYFWKSPAWGENVVGSHGILFLGAFCDSNRMLFPVLEMFDDDGNESGFSEDEIVSMLMSLDDDSITYFTPTEKEYGLINNLYDWIINEMTEKYWNGIEPIIRYNRTKMENWARNREQMLLIDMDNLREEIAIAGEHMRNATAPVDQRKFFEESSRKKSLLERKERTYAKRLASYQEESEKSAEAFRKGFEINPILLPNIILKF